MQPEQLSFWSRLWLALTLPWRILFNPALAARLQRARMGELAQASDATPALQLLSIMQREGRLLDFLSDDVARFSDAQVGAAARVVHEGCRRGLREYVAWQPLRSESEGDDIMLERGFDPLRTRVTGHVLGDPPFRGRLAHHGWQVTEIHLPALSAAHDPKVVAPAEVEVQA